MLINRRRLLKLGGAFAGTLLTPGIGAAQEGFVTGQGNWRKFDIVTRIKFAKTEKSAKAWVPVPSVEQADWSKPLGSDWQTNAASARLEQTESGAYLVYLEWSEETPEAVAEISSHAETRNRLIDFTKPAPAAPLSDEERALYTSANSVMPHDDTLRDMASRATENAETDLGKAKAIYEWIVSQQSCDTGDLKTLLGGIDTNGGIPQDCDYLNRLFVGLARVSGLPAREIFGIRVAPSVYGYESLGAVSNDITTRLHSRAEVWLENYGWVPVDPADLHRLIRYEPPGSLEMTDPKVVSARTTLFGAWEGNWVAYNMAQNVQLPGSDDAVLPVFTKPAVQIGSAEIVDGGAPDISCIITATELPAGP
ncbi:MAG: transglutaminase domain-containing protein [Hyphomicrobiales bacterium]|nr:transglutaminase domain-containing protein [Hyphomicrobiales bacterium]